MRQMEGGMHVVVIFGIIMSDLAESRTALHL